jgi:hypothetical protein
VYVKYRNPGGAPCGPTADSDSGDWIGNSYYGWGEANGNFDFREVRSWGTPGTYMFCIWLAPGSASSATAITQMITFRAPTGTISATLNPVNPAPGQSTSVTVSGVSEAEERVYATVRGAGVPCSATYDADYNLSGSSSVFEGTAVSGNFALTDTLSQSTAGSYVLCLWLADGGADLSPVAGPQPIPFTVGVPTPPAAVNPGPTVECKKARSQRTKWTKSVKKTKSQLLRAKKRATRRKLTKRLASQRRHLRIASANVKTIC